MPQVESALRYDATEKWCIKIIENGSNALFDVKTFDDELSKASQELGFPVVSLNSFLRNIHLKHVKKNASALRNSAQHYIRKYYMEGMSILNLAKKINYPPSMVARAIVEHVASFGAALNRRKVITEAIRDPIRILSSPTIIAEVYRGSERLLHTKAEESTIRDPFSGQYIFHSEHNQITRLAREVMEATQADPLYGPRFDKDRNFVGVEYEIILEQSLRTMGIPFETEDQLRIRGTARTPDILFPCPVAIQIPQMTDMKSIPNPEDKYHELHLNTERNDQGYIWKMVCWIDSKKRMFIDLDLV